jgi:hypothetical protein
MANKKAAGKGHRGGGSGGKPGSAKRGVGERGSERDAPGEVPGGVMGALPQEHINNARPAWEVLPQEERVKLLTLDLGLLRARARQLSDRARAQAGTAPAVAATGAHAVTFQGSVCVRGRARAHATRAARS